MSSTNRGAERIALDAYYTPDDVAQACVGTLKGEIHARTVLEPHAGGGAFVRAAMRAGASVAAVDVNPAAAGLAQGIASQVGDFLVFDGTPEWTLGNPPFTDAEAHVRHAIAISRVGCAFLLRLAFLEGAKRRSFWREHPAAEVYVLTDRVSFNERYEDGSIGPLRKRDESGKIVLGRGGKPKRAGVDSAAYGWFIWRREHVGPTVLQHLDWKQG